MPIELNSKCRTCLCDSDTCYQLIDYVEDNYKILEMLDEIVPQIGIKTSTQFSLLICQNCVDKLIISYKFQQLCIENNKWLNDLLDIAMVESEQILNPLTNATRRKRKQEVEKDCSGIKVPFNDLEREMPSDNVANASGKSNIDLSSSNRLKHHYPVLQSGCNICKNDFRYYSKLKEHMRTHSSETRYSMYRYMGMKKYQCKECPNRYYEKQDLISHGKLHVNGNEIFKTQVFFEENVAECKKEPEDTLEEKVNEAIEFVPLVDVKKEIEIKTEQLEEVMDSFDCLERTNNFYDDSGHSSEKEQLPNFVSKKTKNIVVDTSTHTVILSSETANNVYDCKTKDKVFDSLSILKRHSSAHTSTKSHECPICHYCLGTDTTLKFHMSQHKTGTVNRKPHKIIIKPTCSICKKKFANKFNLKQHLRLHSGERPYACTECSKTFNYANNLKEHMRKHNECPYQCPYCDKSYYYLKSLRYHTNSFHKGLKI